MCWTDEADNVKRKPKEDLKADLAEFLKKRESVNYKIRWNKLPGEMPKEEGGESALVLVAAVESDGRKYVTYDWTIKGVWHQNERIALVPPRRKYIAWADVPPFPDALMEED